MYYYFIGPAALNFAFLFEQFNQKCLWADNVLAVAAVFCYNDLFCGKFIVKFATYVWCVVNLCG